MFATFAKILVQSTHVLLEKPFNRLLLAHKIDSPGQSPRSHRRFFDFTARSQPTERQGKEATESRSSSAKSNRHEQIWYYYYLLPKIGADTELNELSRI